MDEYGATTRAFRECIEMIHSAPLLRMKDEDGTEYVARDDLAAAVREHALRRLHLIRNQS